jgi:hypothetical protein
MLMLSRLEFLDEMLTIESPSCVIKEILYSHGIKFNEDYISYNPYRENLIQRLYEMETVTIQEPFDRSDYRKLITFINPNKKYQWNIETVMKAYHFLEKFRYDRVDLKELDLYFSWGNQTPNNPEKLNATVLYKICHENKIKLFSHTTIDQMAISVKLLKSGPDEIYRMLAQANDHDNLQWCIETFIIGKPMSIVPRYPEKEHINQQDLQPFTLDSNVQGHRYPRTRLEAIAWAGLIYKKDISDSKYPISEFMRLQKKPHAYVPVDKELKRCFTLNPNLLDLTKSFNPLFPRHFYSRDTLKYLLRVEGITPELQDIDYYETLQISQLFENFYFGIYPEVSNEETPISFDEVSSVDPNMIVCYGVRREDMTAFHIEELIDHFNVVKTFAHPVKSHETLEPQAIYKLKALASLTQCHGSEDSILLKQQLLDVIQEVEFFSQETLSKARELHHQYESQPNLRSNVKDCLKSLLELAMYMRGWEGKPHPFPIQECPVFDQLSVDFRVTKAIANLEESCEQLGDIGSMILDLPLLKYQGEFNPSNSQSQGYTVRDRLNIVKQGDSSESMSSCIRLSSNWLAATAYRYLTLIGEDPPFSIDCLRYIS